MKNSKFIYFFREIKRKEKKIKMILLKMCMTVLLYVCVARTTEGNVLYFESKGQNNSFISSRGNYSEQSV